MANQEAPAQPAWSRADEESLSLIFSLLREDALRVKSSSKGKQVEGTVSDADLALRFYTEELKQATAYVLGRKMAKSMQEAVHTDTDALLKCQREESVARRDRQIAVALSGRRVQGQTQKPVDTGSSAPELEPELLEKLNAIYVTGINEADGEDMIDDGTETVSVTTAGHPESSSWAASRRLKKIPQRACTACGDMKHFVDLARAPCQHEYCRECLDNLFRASMLDESLFPPRCCRQVIPVDANRLFLSSDLVQQFKKKSIELSTSNRIYCHQPTCSTFIPPSTIKDGVARCPECTIQTCITCKGATHEGDCPADTALQQVLQVARQEQWQRCPKCSTMIELDTGCFHMTCKCGAEFCYLCAAKWKTCRCAQWEEHRLYERAQEIYDRDHNPDDENADIGVVNGRPVAPGSRQRDIRNIMNHLRENHECDHERWRSRSGRYECEECHQTMPEFIYECRQCDLMACRRCRHNRL
ncbi:hypothetical protein F4782DRAFT_552698 [Xylaria castorea]|nr:hypothetical protein F4782DRAFT_552698 [Xylaria castorea]